MRASRSAVAAFVLSVLAAAPLYFAAHQGKKSLRFELGSMDGDYLATEEQFYSPGAMSGPVRHPDNRVEVIDFYGRLTRREAAFSLPYHALRSPLWLRIRCHRFGLKGTVVLTVNEHSIDEFVFAETSYPWGGIRAVIPQEVAEEGPLLVSLATIGGDPSQGHLPEDFGVGVDWIEVEPLSKAAVLLPGSRQWVSLYAFLLLGFAFCIISGASFRASLLTFWAVLVVVCGVTLFFPHQTAMALARVWIVFPLGMLLQRALAFARARMFAPALATGDVSFVSRTFVIAALAQSILIFFPNHAPPDIALHGLQVGWLDSLELNYDNLRHYSHLVSRRITDGPVLMELRTDVAREAPGGQGQSYGTPYPPFFYFLTFSLWQIHDDLRFLLEFVPVLLGALMLVLVFLTSKAIWNDGVMARLATLLFAVEISLWHHVHRGHAPGIFGAFLVLAFLWVLVAYLPLLKTSKGMMLFMVVSFISVLCYTVALVQLSILVGFFSALVLFGGEGKDRRLLPRLLGSYAGGVAAACAVYYAPYILTALTRGGVLLDRGGAYDAPATFYFLRNQLRDTVRILVNGYPIYVALSLVGFWMLPRGAASRVHRQILWAGLGTYATLLVLKDPAFLPRIFLHAKEDLFYAPIACLLGALPLAALWRRGAWRGAVVAFLLLILVLGLRDQAINSNTLRIQPIARRIDVGTSRHSGMAGMFTERKDRQGRTA
jgi:hypothetical protein